MPQLEQEAKASEQFFVDLTAVQAPSRSDDSAGVFIGDGDDDEPSQATDAGQLNQREGPTVSATGWCNGDAAHLDGSMAITAAETLGQMPHGRWQSCVAAGIDADGHRVHWSAAVDRTGLQARQRYAPRNGEVPTYGDSPRRQE